MINIALFLKYLHKIKYKIKRNTKYNILYISHRVIEVICVGFMTLYIHTYI